MRPLLHRATLGTLWPGIVSVGMAWLAIVYLGGCIISRPPPRPPLIDNPPDLPAPFAEAVEAVARRTAGVVHDLAPVASAIGAVKGQDYSILTYIAGICTFVAVGSALAGVYLPFLRKLAPVAIACAVACWALRVLMVKYLWLAILVAVVCGALVGLLYVYGHRKVFRKRLGV